MKIIIATNIVRGLKERSRISEKATMRTQSAGNQQARRVSRKVGTSETTRDAPFILVFVSD